MLQAWTFLANCLKSYFFFSFLGRHFWEFGIMQTSPILMWCRGFYRDSRESHVWCLHGYCCQGHSWRAWWTRWGKRWRTTPLCQAPTHPNGETSVQQSSLVMDNGAPPPPVAVWFWTVLGCSALNSFSSFGFQKFWAWMKSRKWCW